jgi:hypothetical protein
VSGATPTIRGVPVEKIVAAHLERLSDPAYPRNSAQFAIASRYWEACRKYPTAVAAAKGAPP